MKWGRRGTGFTLIEVMVSIALITLALSIPWTAAYGARSLKRQANYRFALRNAETLIADLRQTPFSKLPPFARVVPSDNILSIPINDVVLETLSVSNLSGENLSFNWVEPGRLKLEGNQAGKKVVLNFSRRVPDQGECHRVDDTGRLNLENVPVVRVVRIYEARGDKLSQLPPTSWKVLDKKNGVLEFDSSLKGRVVTVDYIGKSVGNVVWGEYLTADLNPTTKPGPVKRFVIEETYGEGFHVRLSGLKVSP